MTQTTAVRHRNLRGILQTIRQDWTEEERQRRRQIAAAKQEWLVGVLHAQLQKQAC